MPNLTPEDKQAIQEIVDMQFHIEELHRIRYQKVSGLMEKYGLSTNQFYALPETIRAQRRVRTDGI